MLICEFHDEMIEGRLTTFAMPWIDEVCYGRDCGWGCRRIHLAPEIEQRYRGETIRRASEEEVHAQL